MDGHVWRYEEEEVCPKGVIRGKNVVFCLGEKDEEALPTGFTRAEPVHLESNKESARNSRVHTFGGGGMGTVGGMIRICTKPTRRTLKRCARD